MCEGLNINMQQKMGKLLSTRWKEMDPEEKQLYLDLEAADRS
jgi:hypothetical protein